MQLINNKYIVVFIEKIKLKAIFCYTDQSI